MGFPLLLIEETGELAEGTKLVGVPPVGNAFVGVPFPATLVGGPAKEEIVGPLFGTLEEDTKLDGVPLLLDGIGTGDFAAGTKLGEFA